ncbi:uncharacterized protein PV06_11086 [Exophiala oligosperma]|uniref:Chromo domain-containing protein n=1 Tax=Exophiala oligosperma TaxID=215243 RepID=A0A0D2D071_9EURO|nr:uncharacterized protein PV06_11086 [Exophiala oligosperma]KIW36668.1 hypothetical protein PV06_11086 [Exophiala oligosperma]
MAKVTDSRTLQTVQKGKDCSYDDGSTLTLSTRPNIRSRLVEVLHQRSKHETHASLVGQLPVVRHDLDRQEHQRSPTERPRPKGQLESFHVEYIERSKYDLDCQEVLYEIKWLGYRDAENTWEPRENLLPDCLINMLVHHYLVGSTPLSFHKPNRHTSRPASAKSVNKSSSSAERIINHDNFSLHVDCMNQVLQTDWEQEVVEVEDLHISSSGEPAAVAKLSDGQRHVLTTEWLALHCPLKMLRFYETNGTF